MTTRPDPIPDDELALLAETPDRPRPYDDHDGPVQQEDGL